jgi:hypothetical protein
MRHTAARFIHLGLNSLNRRPVLTAVMVYSIAVGVAVLMAVIAAWRASSRCPTLGSSAGLYVVHIPEDIPAHNGDLSHAQIAVDDRDRVTVRFAGWRE